MFRSSFNIIQWVHLSDMGTSLMLSSDPVLFMKLYHQCRTHIILIFQAEKRLFVQFSMGFWLLHFLLHFHKHSNFSLQCNFIICWKNSSFDFQPVPIKLLLLAFLLPWSLSIPLFLPSPQFQILFCMICCCSFKSRNKWRWRSIRLPAAIEPRQSADQSAWQMLGNRVKWLFSNDCPSFQS